MMEEKQGGDEWNRIRYGDRREDKKSVREDRQKRMNKIKEDGEHSEKGWRKE